MKDKNVQTADAEITSFGVQDPILWSILLGFFIAYLLLFVRPVFANNSGSMMFFRYVPTLKGWIGEDAKTIYYFSLAWSQGKNPYALDIISNGVVYPPLTLLLFSPLSRLTAEHAYLIVVALSIVCFISLTLWFPITLFKRVSPIIVLFLVTGLVSYGFQFELERGQFNVIAMCLCFTAIHLFHNHYESRPVRYLAYLLFIISVQLKIFPAIFALGLVRDWWDWRRNLRRYLALAAINFALLFSAGYGNFLAFKDSLLVTLASTMGEKTNHSIASFSDSMSSLSTSSWLNRTLPPIAAVLRDHAAWMQLVFFGLFVISLGVSLSLVIRRTTQGMIPHFLLVCTIGALMIPSLSFDYKLSILPASMAIFMQQVSADCSSEILAKTRIARRWLRMFLVAAISLAYASTLFSYTNKPDNAFLSSNFLPLLVILLLTPALALLQNADKGMLIVSPEAVPVS